MKSETKFMNILNDIKINKSEEKTAKKFKFKDILSMKDWLDKEHLRLVNDIILNK